MISIDSFGTDIYIRGRDKNGKRYTSKSTQKPYFYVQSKDGEYVTLDDIKVKKVEFEDNGELYNRRDVFNKTWEDNVSLTTRYMLDNLTDIEEEPVRICFLDIETEDRFGFPEPAKGDKPILSIACYDSFTQKYYVFLTSSRQVSDIRVEEFGQYTAKIFERPNEYSMLGEFINFVDALDFDLFYAWNGNFFDYPYIINRMKYLKIEPKELSPYKKMRKDIKRKREDEKTGEITIEMIWGMPYGRNFLDLMEAYKKLSQQKIESYSLDYVSFLELGENKVEHAEKIADMWENDLHKFLKYNLHDVGLMVAIEEKKGITAYFDTIRRMTFCKWEDILYNSRSLDSFMLRKARERHVILPSRKFELAEEDKVEGAIVGVCKTGVTKNVAVIDVKSLYPFAMKTCNMSPETILHSPGHCRMSVEEIENGDIPYCVVEDVYFRMDKQGFIPFVIDDLYELRRKYKAEMHSYEHGSDDYNRLNNMQIVCKFLLNSIYGVSKYKSFRLRDRDVFKSVTYFGRANNRFMQDIVKETGHELVLYDTDSNVFALNSTTYEDMVKEGQYVANLINERCGQWVLDTFGNNSLNSIEVEFETIYGSLFTMKNTDDEHIMKRYAAYVIYEDGLDLRDNPDFIVMGMSSKRSDTPLIFKNTQKEVLKLILNDDIDGAVKMVTKLRKDILNGVYSAEEIGLPSGMSKNIGEYVKTIPPQVRGAIYANNYFGENIIRDKVKYVYIDERSCPVDIPRSDVISFTEKFPECLKVDYERMAIRLVDKQYQNILYTLGYNIDVLKGQTSLFSW